MRCKKNNRGLNRGFCNTILTPVGLVRRLIVLISDFIVDISYMPTIYMVYLSNYLKGSSNFLIFIEKMR